MHMSWHVKAPQLTVAEAHATTPSKIRKRIVTMYTYMHYGINYMCVYISMLNIVLLSILWCLVV